MATSDAVNALLDTILVKVAQKPFSAVAAADAVQKALAFDQGNYRNSVSSEIYGELKPSSSDATNRYKTLGVAYAILLSKGDGYDYGGQFIKSGQNPPLEQKLAREAHLIAVPLYRNYLEQAIAAQQQTFKFLDLFADVAFCKAFVQRVLDPSFINATLIGTWVAGNKEYAQSVAYLYERMRPTLSGIHESDLTSFHDAGGAPLSFRKAASSTGADHWQPHAKVHAYFQVHADQLVAFQAACLPLQWSDDAMLQPPSFPAVGDAFNNEFMRSSATQSLGQGVTTQTTRRDDFDTSMSFGPRFPTLHYNVYGADVVGYMNNAADHGYGDVFNHGAPFERKIVPNWGASCFVPGTLVRTAGGEVPIEKVGNGTQVLAKLPALYGVCSEEVVVIPAADNTVLFGLNEDEPFFTAGHIFWTKGGPKAISVEVAQLENPDVHVLPLRLGDVVFRLPSKGDSNYEEVVVKDFKVGRAEPGSFVHGLHFRKGAKGHCTYHANGYLVAANYPEITMKRLRDGLSRLSHKERKMFPDTIKSLPDSLRTVFGPAITGAFEATFAEQPSQFAAFFEAKKQQLREKTDKRHLHPTLLHRSYPLVHWANLSKRSMRLSSTAADFHDTIAEVNGEHRLPEITVSQGAVLVDGELAPHATVDARQIHWSRPLDGDVWEHGSLSTSSDGTFVHGAVGTGPAPATAGDELKLDTAMHVFAAANSNDYNVLATSKSPTSPSDTGTFSTVADADAAAYPGTSTWTSFYKMEVGLTKTPDGLVKAAVTMPDFDAKWATFMGTAKVAAYSATATVDTTKWTLNVEIRIAAGAEQFVSDLLTAANWPSPPPAFSSISLKLQLATNIMTGNFTELVQTAGSSPAWSAGPMHALHCPYSPKAAALRERVLAAVAGSPHRDAANGLALAASRTDLHSPSANVHPQPAHAAAVAALDAFAAAANDDLPIAFLQTMTTPADLDLHQASQNYIIAASAYWRAPEEVAVFGNEKAAMEKSLPSSLKDGLGETTRTFLKGPFSRGLLNYSMSRNKTYTDKFSADREDKLQFFWSGKTDKCLSQMQEYNNATLITAGLAFNDLADSGFAKYTSSATDYAQKLFTALSDNDILNNLSVSVVLGDQNLVNRFCAILNALDKKSRGFDKQLWKLVRDKQIMFLAFAGPAVGKDFSTFAQEYMQALATKVAQGDPTISKALLDQFKLDLDQMKAGLDANDAAELAFKMFDESTVLGQNIMQVVEQMQRRAASNGQAGTGDFLTKLNDKLKDYPKLQKVLQYGKGIIMVLMQGASLYFTIKWLMKWDTISPQQRAVLVLECLESVIMAVNGIADIVGMLRGTPFESRGFRVACLEWNQRVGKRVLIEPSDDALASDLDRPLIDDDKLAGVGNTGSDDDDLPRSFGQQMSEDGVAADAGALTAADKTFSVGAVAAEVVMVAVNCANAVLLGMQLVAEWNKVPEGIRALDTINLMVQCVQVVTGAMDAVLMVVGAECVAIPVLGVVLAAAGIIMELLEEFIPRPKPDPIQDYLDASGYAYVDALDHSPVPQLAYASSLTKDADGKVLTLDITVTQPKDLAPAPMIDQLAVRVTAGSTETDVFLAPTKDASGAKVTADDITWSVVEGGDAFKLTGNANDAAPADHSLLAQVVPVTPATPDKADPTKTQPGTSVLGTKTLKLRARGTPNPKFESVEATVTEVVLNRPANTAGSDVVWKFTLNKAP